MNQRIASFKLASLLRVEVGLALLFLVGVILGFNYYPAARDAKDERADLESRLVLLRGDLEFVNSGSERDALERELEQLQSAPPTGALPGVGRGDAQLLDASLTAYAASQGVDFTEFEREDSSFVVDEDTVFLAVSYRLTAQGADSALVGLLNLLRDVPTSRVQSLEVTRVEDSQDLWSMGLEILVAYEEARG